ncbi:hypothetical protein FQR65_LT20453 [Abscondita terminalis]|nr:hypothetical protein FQR65_LT20453 [Abscondita terminalis]
MHRDDGPGTSPSKAIGVNRREDRVFSLLDSLFRQRPGGRRNYSGYSQSGALPGRRWCLAHSKAPNWGIDPLGLWGFHKKARLQMPGKENQGIWMRPISYFGPAYMHMQDSTSRILIVVSQVWSGEREFLDKLRAVLSKRGRFAVAQVWRARTGCAQGMHQETPPAGPHYDWETGCTTTGIGISDAAPMENNNQSRPDWPEALVRNLYSYVLRSNTLDGMPRYNQDGPQYQYYNGACLVIRQHWEKLWRWAPVSQYFTKNIHKILRRLTCKDRAFGVGVGWG